MVKVGFLTRRRNGAKPAGLQDAFLLRCAAAPLREKSSLSILIIH